VRKIARGKKVTPVVWDETDGVTAAVGALAVAPEDEEEEEDYVFKFCETLTEKNLFNYFKEDKDSIMDDPDLSEGVRDSVTQFRVALDTSPSPTWTRTRTGMSSTPTSRRPSTRLVSTRSAATSSCDAFLMRPLFSQPTCK
jgi:hypothetical protein